MAHVVSILHFHHGLKPWEDYANQNDEQLLVFFPSSISFFNFPELLTITIYTQLAVLGS